MKELKTPSFVLNPRFIPLFETLEASIDEAKTIALCAHTKPDGDAFGSVLALAALLEKVAPEKEIFCLLADNEEPSQTFSFLKPQEKFLTPAAFEQTCRENHRDLNLFISLDTPLLRRLGHAGEIAEHAKKVISIDHHLSRQLFADSSIVDENAAATGVLVGQFLLYLQEKLEKQLIDAEIANDLFLALMTDTGRFQYQNASSECFALAAWLVANGAEPSFLSTQIYQSEPLALLKLKARVTERITLHCDGLLAYSFATADDFEELGIRPTDADGLVDIVRSVGGSQIALFLKELEQPIAAPVQETSQQQNQHQEQSSKEVNGQAHIRGSLRAKGDADVASIAAHFSGGGHRAAAGFSATGTLESVAKEVIELAKKTLR